MAETSNSAAIAARRFTDVPQDLLRNIISRLPVEEAVQTSALSQFWRGQCQPSLYIHNLPATLVSQLLQHYSGLIETLHLREGWGNQRETEHIMNWFANLPVPENANSTLKTLILNLQRASLDLHQILLCFPHLISLQQRFRAQLDPDFGGFLNLQVLHVSDNHEYNGGLSRLISRCPLLETLKILMVTTHGLLEIDAPNL